MPFWIDEFLFVRSGVFVRGWSDAPVRLVVDGVPFGEVVSERRDDLAPRYGKGSGSWGFKARGFVDIPVPHKHVALLVGGELFTAGRFAGVADQKANTLLDSFLAEMSAGDKSVLEFGSRARSGISRRGWFGNCRYIGVDILPGENVDVVGDVHFLTELVDGPVDGVMSISTFEHLIMPWLAAAKINSVLSAGGLVYTASHQTWPIHDAPWDFFRFSDNAWRGIFNEATGFEIIGAEMAEACLSTPALQLPDNDATRIDPHPGYLRSVCLARKIGPASAYFDVPREMYERIVQRTIYPA
jgi:hypothetical protein